MGAGPGETRGEFYQAGPVGRPWDVRRQLGEG